MMMKMMTMTLNFVDVISVGDILCGDRAEQFASDSLGIKREQVFRFPAQSTSRPRPYCYDATRTMAIDMESRTELSNNAE